MLLPARVTVVAGAGVGIGAAIALRLTSEGAIIIVADLDATWAAATAAQIVSVGGQASFHRTDVIDPASVDSLIRFAVTKHGRLDATVNSAGIHETPALMHELPVDEWRRVIDVNLTRTWHCVRAELARTKRDRQRRIYLRARGRLPWNRVLSVETRRHRADRTGALGRLASLGRGVLRHRRGP